MTEFNLSEKKIDAGCDIRGINYNIYNEKDVKEFMRLLKEEFEKWTSNDVWKKDLKDIVDKLAGEKLK